MASQFYVPTRVVVGPGCVREKGELMAPLGKAALVVTGANSAKVTGALDDVLAALSANGQTWAVFDGSVPNPTVDSVYLGVAAAKACKADFIVAIGGGSPMDTAKAVALVSVQDLPREEIFSGRYQAKALPIVCIPTTSGTGSETTQYSIITNDIAKTKTSLANPVLFPRLAYLDGGYTYGLSHKTTVNTAIDALSHCVEGMLSNLAGDISDALAKEGIGRIAACFDALAQGKLTPVQRDSLMLASTLGGMVISGTGTTAVHALGYSMTYFHHVDHGRANGLFLAPFMAFCAKTQPGRVEEILHAFGYTRLSQLEEAMARLLGETETVTDEEAVYYASLAIKTGNIAKCLVTPTEADLLDILRGSLVQ